jgi:hypothetical protein
LGILLLLLISNFYRANKEKNNGFVNVYPHAASAAHVTKERKSAMNEKITASKIMKLHFFDCH